MKFSPRFALFTTSAIVAIALSTASQAQEMPLAGEENVGAEEIVVTAQRREERLQDVPIAITAIGSEALSNRGVTDLSGISQVSPSLNLVSYPNSSDTIALNMRGQGTADPGQITKDGGVGIYIDGFYIARPQAALFDLGDPERVEVLRGPQGTLYGRNTTGGAINIITQKPSGEWGGDVQMTVGSRNLVRALADVELPAIGNLALKGTILYSQQDGWVKNQGPNNFMDFGQFAGRIAARWTPTPELTVDYAWDRGEVTSTMPYYVNPALVGTIPGYTADRDRTYAPLDIPTSKSNFVDHQLTFNWDASDSVTLRSLSSYRGTRSRQFVNYGLGQSLPFFPIEVEQQHLYRAKQYTQEFQIVGSIGDRIEYTGGLYYFREEGSHDQEAQLTAGGFLVESSRLIDALSVSKAAYAQATIIPPVLDDRLKITVGGRYTRDLRTATRNSTSAGAPVDINISNRRKFENFSPSLNVAMQWSRDVMTYAKMSKGYKAGGSSEGGPDFRATFQPEKVTTYEVGFKSQMFDRKLTLNVAGFYNKFDNLQIDFVNNPQDTSVVSTVNAGKAEVKGVEAEVIFQPTRDITLRGSYAYLDPKLKQVLAPAGTVFDPAINPASPVNPGDNVTGYFTLPFIPEHAFTISGDWTAFRSGGHEVSLHGSFNYQSPMYTSSAAGPDVPGRAFHRNRATDIVNARISWSMPIQAGESFKLSVFANNLLDERHTDFVIGTGNALTGFTSQTAPWSEPRVIGVEGRLTF